MKFKNIEISAFRIYDNPKDARFDFTNSQGEIADFVSIFAPNGFGKTSFYDAVEWGVTNNIERFWKNIHANENIDAQRSSNDSKQVILLKNKKSKRDTYVKIQTNNENIKFCRELKVHGRKKSDLSNNDVVENPAFRQVILSQEWISAFLKEDDGQMRYKKFVSNSELSKMDSYYNEVKTLQGVCSNRIHELQHEIEKYKKQIKDFNEDNLLESINNQISKLSTEYKQSLKRLSLSSTDKDILELKNKISDAMLQNNREQKLVALLNCVTKAKVGDENTIGVKAYFENCSLYNALNKEIESINEIIKKYDALDANNNIIHKLTSDRSAELDKLTLYNSLIELYPTYDVIRNAIGSQTNEINVKTENLDKLNIKAQELLDKEIINKNAIKSFQEKIDKLNIDKNSIPLIIEDTHKAKLQIDKVHNNINNTNSRIKELNNEILKIETVISSYLNDINIVNSKVFPIILSSKEAEIIDKIKLLELASNDLKKTKISLGNLEAEIVQQQSLNSSIEIFIKSGLEIINKKRTSTCPLCDHNYTSYEQLASVVSNNKALNNVLQNSLSEKNKLVEALSLLNSKYSECTKEIIGLLNNKYDASQQSKMLLIEEKAIFTKQLSEYMMELSNLEKIISDITSFFGGSTVEDFSISLDKQVFQLNTSMSEWQKINTQLSEEINQVNQVIGIDKDNINLLKQSILTLKYDERYNKVANWVNKNYKEKPSLESFLSIESKSKKLVEELSTQIEQINAIQSKLNNELISHKLDSLVSKQNDLNIKKDNVELKTLAYYNFVKTNLNIDVEGCDFDSCVSLLIQKETYIKREIQATQNLISEYSKLDKYCDNIGEFLMSEKLRTELREKEDELKFIDLKVVQVIDKEKKGVEDYLRNLIKKFFYEDLINELYKRIDPHPEFKSVKFETNFDSAPSLNIYVTNNKNEESLIPNLYFSSAQINILSLSVFLASAMNSTEYDCIFIDDPIQSMDSINMLSTIDLLRSITVNYGKQIILSTHDKNFHNLLEKKIPSNIFKSKFIELETFGKVSCK